MICYHKTALLLAALLLAACTDSHSAEGRASDAATPDAMGSDAAPACDTRVRPLSVLFVVDNTSSGLEEQAALLNELPRTLRALSSGDIDDDGVADFPAPAVVRLGVVTTDMGTGSYPIPPSCRSGGGDDGILRSEGNTSRPGCSASYAAIQTVYEGDDIERVAQDLGCVAAVGTDGCGMEQPLEAALKAITSAASSITFMPPGSGHGDGANVGFLEAEGRLAIFLLTDEDDCSALDPRIFDPSSPLYAVDLNFRCTAFPEALQPVERYVDGFLSTRDPGDLIFFVHAGVPTDLLPAPGAAVDFAAVLEDARMRVEPDPEWPTRNRHSCRVPEGGNSYPPQRLVQVAQGLEGRGATVALGSTCTMDSAPSATAFLEAVAAAHACPGAD